MSRPDEGSFRGLLKQIFVLKIVMIAMVICTITLTLSTYMLSQKAVDVVVIDGNGNSHWTTKADGDVFKNMAVAETKDFLESLHSYDSDFAPIAREKASWYLAPSLREPLKATINDSSLVSGIVSSGAQSQINWNFDPKIVRWEYPKARLYGSFDVGISFPNGEESVKSQNVSVDVTFYGSSSARPSGMFITGFTYLSGTDLNDILNTVGG